MKIHILQKKIINRQLCCKETNLKVSQDSKHEVLTLILDQDIADKVTAEWKVMYKECSAKDPEAVTDLFKSVMGVFEEVGVHHFEEDEKGHDYDRPKPCTIL